MHLQEKDRASILYIANHAFVFQDVCCEYEEVQILRIIIAYPEVKRQQNSCKGMLFYSVNPIYHIYMVLSVFHRIIGVISPPFFIVVVLYSLFVVCYGSNKMIIQPKTINQSNQCCQNL